MTKSWLSGIDFKVHLDLGWYIFTMDRMIAPIVNWTHHQLASSLSVFGADLSVDPTPMRLTPPYASNSTNDADGIAMPVVATLPSCQTNDSSLRVDVNIDGPLPPDFFPYLALIHRLILLQYG